MRPWRHVNHVPRWRQRCAILRCVIQAPLSVCPSWPRPLVSTTSTAHCSVQYCTSTGRCVRCYRRRHRPVTIIIIIIQYSHGLFVRSSSAPGARDTLNLSFLENGNEVPDMVIVTLRLVVVRSKYNSRIWPSWTSWVIDDYNNNIIIILIMGINY